MKTLVIGANGQIGKQLVGKLAARGESVRAMVRSEAQRSALEELGVEVVIGDLEGAFAPALDGCQALVFTAGSGGHTGGDKTLLVDLWGALKTFQACQAQGVRRYLMVSARSADDPDQGPAAIRHYLVAKHVADDYLQRSGLDYTILRPGRLTNDPGTGHIRTTRPAGPEQIIPREDVADVLLACLADDRTIGKTFELYQGSTPILEALQAV